MSSCPPGLHLSLSRFCASESKAKQHNFRTPSRISQVVVLHLISGGCTSTKLSTLLQITEYSWVLDPRWCSRRWKLSKVPVPLLSQENLKGILGLMRKWERNQSHLPKEQTPQLGLTVPGCRSFFPATPTPRNANSLLDIFFLTGTLLASMGSKVTALKAGSKGRCRARLRGSAADLQGWHPAGISFSPHCRARNLFFS